MGMANVKPTAPSEENDTAAFRKAVEDGVESLNAGRSIPYERVRRWLLSWGTEKELPPPECP
jgi:predicted transcriptional regulator